MRSNMLCSLVGVTWILLLSFGPTGAVAAGMASPSYGIPTDVSSGGGGLGTSPNFRLLDTVGQPTPIGILTSPGFVISAGYGYTSSFHPVPAWSDVPERGGRTTPDRLELGGPNPAGPPVSLVYGLPVTGAAGPVRLRVVDAGGREVATLDVGPYEPGFHAITWNGRDHQGVPVPAGIYFLDLRSGRQQVTRKLIVVR
jgi:hypothetical protein